jgi:hypothetical protein
MNNYQLAISIKSLFIIANFEMLIFQFALICEKGWAGGGARHRWSPPRGKVVEDISKMRMFPRAWTPSPLPFNY